MENITQKELRKIQKLEKRQGILTGYVSKIGKLLLYILPLVLVVITILTLFQISQDAILYVIFYIVLVIYGINSLILFYGASLTKKSFQSRL